MKTGVVSLACALFTLWVAPATAGLYTDDLSRCLVEQTSTADRIALVRWMFAAGAANPAVSTIADVSAEEMDTFNKEVGQLFTRLLTQTCREQTKKALKFEGPATLQLAFQVLGQVAGSELFAHEAVARQMSGLESYTDSAALEALAKEP